MKSISRIVVVLLCAVLFIGTFSSCGTDNTDTVVWKVYAATNDTFVAKWQNALNELLAEKEVGYSVRIETYDESIFAESRTIIPIDALIDLRENKEQVDVITTDTSGSYQLFEPGVETYSTYINTYADAVSNDILLPLNDYLESAKGQELKNAILPEFLERNTIDGKIYGITQKLAPVSSTFYNKELLEKYNIDVSSLSPDPLENEEIFKMVYEGERESEGRFATYLTSIAERSLDMWIFDDYDAIAFDADSEKFINVYESEEFKNYIEKLYELKEENLVCYSYGSSYDNFFAQSKYVVKTSEIYEDTYSFNDTTGEVVEKEVVVIPNIERPYTYLYFGGFATGIASWSKNKDNAFDFLTRLYTDPDIANLVQYGVEGENYTLENGRVIEDYSTENMWQDVGQNFTNELITYPSASKFQKEAENKQAYMEEYFANEPDGLPVGFYFDPTTVNEELSALDYYDSYDKTETPLFRFEADDIDVALENINTKLYELGLQNVLDEIQRQYDEWKAGQA